MTEESKKALKELGIEIARRDQEIVDNWLKTHKRPHRGVIEPEKRRALIEEGRLRTIEILKKYGDYKGKGDG